MGSIDARKMHSIAVAPVNCITRGPQRRECLFLISTNGGNALFVVIVRNDFNEREIFDIHAGADEEV